MAAIDTQEFLKQCRAANPLFTESAFASLLEKIRAYNTNLQLGNQVKTLQSEVGIQGVLRGLSQDLKTKYAKALGYVQAKIKGALAKPDDSAIFKLTLPIASRSSPLEIRGEGFPSLAAIQEVGSNLAIICPLIHDLAKSDHEGPRRNWFAQGSLAEVQTSIVNLDQYLNSRCTGISFKVLQVGGRCDSDTVVASLAGQVVPTVMLDGEDRPDFRKPSGYLKVPPGLRIFLGPLYFSVNEHYDAVLKTVGIYRFMTLFHELSHKIIKTTDVEYELPNCLRIKDTAEAVKCADSWGYFLTDYANSKKRLPGQRGA
jgi:hypothetical protein